MDDMEITGKPFWQNWKWEEALERVEVQVAIKTGLAGALGWALGIGISHVTDRPDSLVSGLWCTLTAIIVLQVQLGGTYKAALFRFLGVIVGSFLGGLSTTLLGSNPLSLALSIFFTVVFCAILNLKDSIRIACVSVTVVMVLWGLRPGTSPWTFAFFRVLDSCLGIIVAVVIAHTLWPFQATEKMRLNMGSLLSDMNQLYRLITTAKMREMHELDADCNQLIDEVEICFHQDVTFLSEAKLELLAEPERLEDWTLLHDHLERLFTAVMSLKQVYASPWKLVDADLAHHTLQLIETTDKTMQELSHSLTVGTFDAPSLATTLARQELLQNDLIRFRNTRATRQATLTDVENFYVFFYSLNSVVVEMRRVAKKINALFGSAD